MGEPEPELPVCRFCLDSTAVASDPFIQPCDCKGSVENVHRRCLLRWIYRSGRATLNEECNMCRSFYIYEIPSLEESATEYSTIIYYLSATPVVGLWFFGVTILQDYIPMTTQMVAAQSLIAGYYLYATVTQMKNKCLFVFYYFKHWSAHLLAVASVLIIMNRYDNGLTLLIYNYLASLVWYSVRKVDSDIRVRINARVLRDLLDDRVGG
jgi:hypothetical protein